MESRTRRYSVSSTTSTPPSSIYTSSDTSTSRAKQRPSLTREQALLHARRNYGRPFALPTPLEVKEDDEATCQHPPTTKESERKPSRTTVKGSKADAPTASLSNSITPAPSSTDGAKDRDFSKHRRRKPPESKTLSPFISNLTMAKVVASNSPSLTHVLPFDGILGDVEDIFGPDLRSPNATDYPKFETMAERRDRRRLQKLFKGMQASLPQSSTAQWVAETENVFPPSP